MDKQSFRVMSQNHWIGIAVSLFQNIKSILHCNYVYACHTSTLPPETSQMRQIYPQHWFAPATFPPICTYIPNPTYTQTHHIPTLSLFHPKTYVMYKELNLLLKCYEKKATLLRLRVCQPIILQIILQKTRKHEHFCKNFCLIIFYWWASDVFDSLIWQIKPLLIRFNDQNIHFGPTHILFAIKFQQMW